MADMITGDPNNFPINPIITIEMSSQPIHNNFTRYLTFEDHTGAIKRLKIKFKRQSGLLWEVDSYPNGITVLESLVAPGNRSYWDNICLENRGGTTTLPIKHLKIVMVYNNPAGLSPSSSDHIINDLDLAFINHAEIPIVDWEINMTLLSGMDKIDLNEFRKRSLHKWAELEPSDPDFVRAAIEDLGKSGSDGSDQFPSNPKYGGAISLLCSEFVSWYFHQNNITLDGQSLANIVGTQQLHDLFKSEGKLYRYNSGNNLQDFVKHGTNDIYIPQPGDYLERRGPNGAEHSMIIYRWLPKDPTSNNTNDQLNQALVINGPWPVTFRLVRIHKDEKATGNGNPKDYWLGRLD